MALTTDSPRDCVGPNPAGVFEIHVPADNVLWCAGEPVGMDLATGIAAPLAAGLLAIGVVPEGVKRDLTTYIAGAERIQAQMRPFAFPQDGSFAADAATGLPVYWDSTANEAVDTDDDGANAYLGDLIRCPSTSVVHVDVRMANSLRARDAATLAALGAPSMQAANATLVSGTATINTGITVATNSEVIVEMINALTGTTNLAEVGELKASRVTGAPGTGTIVVQAYGDDGAIDVDAAGVVRVIILTPQS